MNNTSLNILAAVGVFWTLVLVASSVGLLDMRITPAGKYTCEVKNGH